MNTLALNSGKQILTKGVKISGLVSCIPKQVIDNNHFLKFFDQSAIDEVIKMIGVNSRRWVDSQTTTRDLCKHAGEKLLDELEWDKSSVDALIFVSQTPDFRLPATACALQADLDLNTSSICFDINLGCSGYPYALWLGMTMIQSGAASRVLLAVGETPSRIVDPLEKATTLLFGDAGTVTALEASQEEDICHFILGTDGKGVNNLIIPQGGTRDYSLSGDNRLIGKNPLFLYMDGSEVFNFTLSSVPPLVANIMQFAGKQISDYDNFLFHQANLFMLKHIIKKTKLPLERAPINIDKYGNTSSASIPLLITTNLKDQISAKPTDLCMFGFGVGYSWAAASMRIGPLKVAKTIEI
jgi:3-oxoacyl-[acyl-carrier-protein] synthase-3